MHLAFLGSLVQREACMVPHYLLGFPSGEAVERSETDEESAGTVYVCSHLFEKIEAPMQ